MNKKYIFFDIDGTLTNANPGGIILPSTLRTLRKLEENGHFVAIATGRSYSMAINGMNDSGIKNAVCCGGNGLVIDEKVIYIKPIEKDAAIKIINELKEKNLSFGVRLDDSVNCYSHDPHFFDKAPEMKNFAKFVLLDNDNYEQYDEIHKIHIALSKDDDIVLESLKETGYHYARYHDLSIIVEPDDKYKGILDMIHYLGGNEDDVVVFGDGHNDLSMMKQAPIGIAMGNAIDKLKEVATFITKPNTENGIEYACQYFGWIDKD